MLLFTTKFTKISRLLNALRSNSLFSFFTLSNFSSYQQSYEVFLDSINALPIHRNYLHNPNIKNESLNNDQFEQTEEMDYVIEMLPNIPFKQIISQDLKLSNLMFKNSYYYGNYDGNQEPEKAKADVEVKDIKNIKDIKDIKYIPFTSDCKKGKWINEMHHKIEQNKIKLQNKINKFRFGEGGSNLIQILNPKYNEKERKIFSTIFEKMSLNEGTNIDPTENKTKKLLYNYFENTIINDMSSNEWLENLPDNLKKQIDFGDPEAIIESYIRSNSQKTGKDEGLFLNSQDHQVEDLEFTQIEDIDALSNWDRSNLKNGEEMNPVEELLNSDQKFNSDEDLDKSVIVISSQTRPGSSSPVPSNISLNQYDAMFQLEYMGIYNYPSTVVKNFEYLNNLMKNIQTQATGNESLKPLKTLFTYYYTLPEWARNHPGVRNLFLALEYTKPDLEMKQKELALNYACSLTYPLSPEADECLYNAALTRPIKLTSEHIQKVLPTLGTDPKVNVENLFEMANKNYDMFEGKDDTYVKASFEEYMKLLLSQIEPDNPEDVKEEQWSSLYGIMKENIVKYPSLRRPREDPNPILPLDYYDNDDGFWDEFIERKKKDMATQKIGLRRCFFKH